MFGLLHSLLLFLLRPPAIKSTPYVKKCVSCFPKCINDDGGTILVSSAFFHTNQLVIYDWSKEDLKKEILCYDWMK